MSTTQKGPRSGIGDVAMRLANYDLVLRENAVLRREIQAEKAAKIKVENRNYHLRQKLARLEK